MEFVSAREGIGVEELADRLVGRVSVVTGPSGVGKSTLLNAIQPGLRIDTGAVSGAIHKGRHTTTSAELHVLTAPGGGYVADTPGSASWASGTSRPTSWRGASPRCGLRWAGAASTTAGTWPSHAARCALPWRLGP